MGQNKERAPVLDCVLDCVLPAAHALHPEECRRGRGGRREEEDEQKQSAGPLFENGALRFESLLRVCAASLMLASQFRRMLSVML